MCHLVFKGVVLCCPSGSVCLYLSSVPLASLQGILDGRHGSLDGSVLEGHGRLHHQDAAAAQRMIHAVFRPQHTHTHTHTHTPSPSLPSPRPCQRDAETGRTLQMSVDGIRKEKQNQTNPIILQFHDLLW